MPFGTNTEVFDVYLTDIKPSEDVPVFRSPTGNVTEGRS